MDPSNDLEQNHWTSPAPSPLTRRSTSIRPAPDSVCDEPGERSGLRTDDSHTERSSTHARRPHLPDDGTGAEQAARTTLPEELQPSDSEDLELEVMSSDGAVTDDEETGLTKMDKRRRRRRRKATLEERIGGGEALTAKEEIKLADIHVLKRLAINVILIGSW